MCFFILVSEDLCQDNFTVYTNMAAPNGQPYQEIGTLVGCINRCIAMDTCLGFNYNKNPEALVK